MNKEPIGLYIFRFILGLGLFAFMMMLYWSSLLLEDHVKGIKTEISELKNDVYNLRNDTQAINQSVIKGLLDEQKRRDEVLKRLLTDVGIQNEEYNEKNSKSFNKNQNETAFQNLLNKDPFYEKTLPKLLGSDFKPWGTQQEAVLGRPNNLHPFSNWANVASWLELCSVSLSQMQFGRYETMAPDMAVAIEERQLQDSNTPEFWVHLRDGVYWQPLNPKHFPDNFQLAPHFLQKHKVTAHDFKFYVDAIMNPFVQDAAVMRTYLGDIKEIEVIDDLTLVVRWKTHEVKEPNGSVVPKVKYIAKQLTGSLTPLASFVYKYFPDGKKIIEDDSDPNTYRTNSVWAQNFQQHWAANVIVSCGPWVFDGMTDRQISFKRNADFYQPLRALSQRIEQTIKDSPDSIWTDFKAGKLDTYSLQPDRLIELEEFLNSKEYQDQAKNGLAIHQIQYLARTYSYIGWNEARPFFNNKDVRRAMTLAIDRKRIIQQILNKMGEEITGPFFKDSPSNNNSITPWPYDPIEARRLLEANGWYDSDGDGIIDKTIDGKKIPFRFSLTYYVKNPTGKTIAEYISTALREIGVDCQLHGVDVADLSAVFEDKNFDALFLAWALGTPPEEPRQLWHSSGAKEKGSSNAIGFANKEVDDIIDQLQYEYNSNKRTQLYHRLHEIMHDEQPYTFLYSPKATLVYREYVQNVFIPKDRPDLVPGADVSSPDPRVFYLKPVQ